MRAHGGKLRQHQAQPTGASDDATVEHMQLLEDDGASAVDDDEFYVAARSDAQTSQSS